MFFCLVSIVCSMISVQFVFACDALQNANGQSTCVIEPFMGQTGVWFTLGKADELRTAHDLVPNLKLQLDSYDKLVGDYKKSLDNMKFVADARGETIDDLQKALAKETKRANDAELRANPWYTSPILWGIVGFAGGVTLVAVVRR